MKIGLREEKIQLTIEAFKAISNWSRMVIAVASGVLALNVTLSSATHLLQYFSWTFLLISILSGGWLVGSITAHLNTGVQGEELNVHDPRLLRRSMIQWISFILGMVLFVYFDLLKNLFN